VDAPFSIECRTNAQMEITIIVQDLQTAVNVHRRMLQSASLRGQGGTPPARITVSSLTLYGVTKSSGEASRFRFLPSDNGELRITGQSLPRTGVVTAKFGLINFLLPNSIHARLSGRFFNFDPLGNYSMFEQKLSTGEPEVTTEVTIVCTPSDLKSLDRTMRDVTLLLSFAAGTYISIAYADVLLNNVVIATVIRHEKFLDYYDRVPVIDIRIHPGHLQFFLQGSFDHYQTLKKKLRLDLALEYCIMAKSATYLDIKFVVIFIALESLLTRLQNHIPRKETGWIETFFTRLKRAWTFLGKEKPQSLVLVRLQKALEYYSLNDRSGVSAASPSNGSPNYAKIRNWLVHGGKFPKNVNPLQVTYSALDTYQRLLLAILGYRDFYIDCSVQPFATRIVD